MQEVLALSLQAMHLDMQRLDRISSNLANALTPGYKREVVASQALGMGSATFASMVTPSEMDVVATTKQVNASPVVPLLVQVDARPGTLKSTGQNLDLAIAGPGYFEVTTDTGPAYTRQGNFQLDTRGRLVTAQGWPVMGKSGEIYLNSPSPVIDSAGNVYESLNANGKPLNLSRDRLSADQGGANTQAVAQLRVVEFDNPKSLQRLGEGLVGGAGDTRSLNDADIQIHQGFLENSNVTSMQEMVQLMQTMRHFESMQKVALGYDDMTGQAIRKLGDLS